MTDSQISEATSTTNSALRTLRHAVYILGTLSVIFLLALVFLFARDRVVAAHDRERIEDVNDLRERDANTAKNAFITTCLARNDSIRDINEARDANADLLEGLRQTITITDPEVVDLLDVAISRDRVVTPPLDCTYPPNTKDN